MTDRSTWGIYNGRTSVTAASSPIESWKPGQFVSLEGLRIKVIRVTHRPLTDDERARWPNSPDDDKMVEVEFVEAPL